MNIKEIVEKYLKENGFDGLAGENCGCKIGDLMPCDNPSPNCVAGYKATCKDCPKSADCDYHNEPDSTCISEEKPK